VGLWPLDGAAGAPVVSGENLVADHGQEVLDLGDRVVDVPAEWLGVLVAGGVFGEGRVEVLGERGVPDE
jgi:hypothetical protein